MNYSCYIFDFDYTLVNSEDGIIGMRLCVMHNLYFYNTMMEEIRDAIRGGYFKSYKEDKLKKVNGET